MKRGNHHRRRDWQMAALRRCVSREAYKALARDFIRTSQRSRQAGLKAAKTLKQQQWRKAA